MFHELLGRAARETKIKFLLVGAWNTLFGYLVFIGLNALFLPVLGAPRAAYMTAMVIATIVAIINAFVFHKYITFRSRVRGFAILNELARFSTTYLITFALSCILLPVFVEIFHLGVPVAGAIITIICTGISYVGHSRFSFANSLHSG